MNISEVNIRRRIRRDVKNEVNKQSMSTNTENWRWATATVQYNPVLSSLMTFHWILHKSGASSRAVTDYPSRAIDFSPVLVESALLFFYFMCSI